MSHSVSTIQEFFTKCRASQDLIQTQIPWASAGAERSRIRQLESLGPDSMRNGEELPPTREERLLGELLAANEELAEALRIYGDIERIGVETEAEKKARERSKVEVRVAPIVRTQQKHCHRPFANTALLPVRTINLAGRRLVSSQLHLLHLRALALRHQQAS